MERLWYATLNTWNGLRTAAASEAALRQELAVLVLGIPAAFFLAADPWKRAALIGVLLLLVVVELLNTAIEKLSDHVTRDTHPAIKRVKDMGSAAVGVCLALAGLVWLTALGEFAGLW